MGKLIIVDNYDSFTYNLVHSVEQIMGTTIDVVRNDKVALSDFEQYDKIILSPGPGIPDEAGLLKKIIKTYYKTKPILGVCLGLQAIVEVFGGRLINLKQVFHGIQTEVIKNENESPIFSNISSPFNAGRYHSWVASPKNFPEELVVTAKDEDGTIMALQHKKHPVFAVQFHPESVLTPSGDQIIENFINF